jgi:DNA-binding MarR family transcriptional regulator
MPRSTDDLVAELDRHWVEIGRTFVRRREPGTERGAHDLSPVQLLAIAQLTEPLKVGALAARLGIAESSATRLVDRLELLGLVARTPDPDDRRSVAVALTLGGRRAAEKAARRRRDYLGEILDALEPGERVQLVYLFAKVVEVQSAREGAARTAAAARRSTA